MPKITVTLPDGGQRQVAQGVTAADVAKEISPRLLKDAACAELNGQLVDLTTVIKEDASFAVIPLDSKPGLDVLRHTVAHVMAQAVTRLWPNVKLAIGPTIADGFYYDFDMPALSSDDLERVEAEMNRIIKENLPIHRQELSAATAKELFSARGETYKLELIADLQDTISVYSQGDFTDLCRGPHLTSTGKIKAFKLLSVAGAYWRGDSDNRQLQRIYGTAFGKKSQLQEYLVRLEEAAKRDHRKLGRELDLFSIQDEGPGFPFFHPKGMVLRNALEDFWRHEHVQCGYKEVKTPIILRDELWKRSGHWDHYKENMYFTQIDDQDFAIKPMNCPGGMLLYKRKMYSYRDLPERTAELGLVHRHELSGTLHGLMRVRCFTQDDAHIFMHSSQIQSEIEGVIDLIDRVYRGVFGFTYHVELSTKPNDAMGDDVIWDKATEALQQALENKGLPYEINHGDGAFYGPKIDFHLEDCLQRTWQCGTVQLDFVMPERFDLSYIGEDGQKHRPVMLHRVVFGSIERFIAILTEHFAGAFPLWLAPIQVEVIPVSDDFLDYGRKIASELVNLGVRAEVDERSEKMGYKIRSAQMQKIPYMLIVGEKEMQADAVAVRHRSKGDLGLRPFNQFLEDVCSQIAEKTLDD